MKLLEGLAVLHQLRAPKQVISTYWDEREAILHPDVNLFCWKRREKEDITKYLLPLINLELQPISFFTNVNDLSKNLEASKHAWSKLSNEENDSFWKDVHLLVHDFISLSESKSGTVHLKTISDDACTKFHTDGYTMRLFTTYYGQGTEWLPEKATNRKGLGKSNELIVRDTSQVQQMDTFDVGILKGELPNRSSQCKGIVHRSPAITETGEKRIILRVDV